MTPGQTFQRRRISVAEAEAENIPQDQDPERIKKYPQLAKPFGFANDEWEALEAQMRAGDELWECCTDEASWDELRGIHWIELNRGQEEVAWIILAIN